MAKKIELTNEQINNLEKLYSEYGDLKIVSKISGFHKIKIYRTLKNRGIIFPGVKIIHSEEIINKVLILYNSGVGSNGIGKELNIPPQQVRKILKSNNIEFRGSRRYHPNEDFFEKIDTEEKAYWLGFLYADGCVQVRKRNSVLKLKLAIKDLEHVEKFKQTLNADNPIKFEVSKVKYKDGYSVSSCCYISIASRKMVNDLINNGCIPNKTKKLQFPKENQVPNELICHFIRGYFDGDGSISKNIENSICVNFVSGNYGFIEKLQEIISIKAEIKKMMILDRKTHFYIQWYGIDNMNKIYDLFYKKSNVYLNRKNNKFKQIKEEYEIRIK